jgi:hypothetical protein
MIAEGDKVVLRWTMRGAQPGGRLFRLNGITINQLQDGKIIEDYVEASDPQAPDTEKNKGT